MDKPKKYPRLKITKVVDQRPELPWRVHVVTKYGRHELRLSSRTYEDARRHVVYMLKPKDNRRPVYTMRMG